MMRANALSCSRRAVPGVLARVLEGFVSGNLRRDVVTDTAGDVVGVVEQCPQLLVEALKDVR